jgi:transcriptional regulator with XRE-family HTH domain
VQTLQTDDGAKEKRRKNTGKITLAEVAKLVGVSTMTVSRALRMPEKVNPELRTRIEAAVSELGYVPNLQARSLASADSTLVMGVVPFFIARFYRRLGNATNRPRAAGLYHDVYRIWSGQAK